VRDGEINGTGLFTADDPETRTIAGQTALPDRDSHPIRVLLVDDDEDYFVLTSALFDEIQNVKFDVQWVSSYEEGLQAITRGACDVYLVDYRLGARNGLELLREAMHLGCSAPIIILTGQGDHEVDVESMRAGAADYLVKGQFGPPLLERSIRYAMERAHTLDALRESEERYELAVRGAKDGVWDWNLKTDEVYFSGRWMAMIGCDEQETRTSSDEWFGRVHPGDIERIKSKIHAHIEGGTPHFECEFRMRHQDGGYRWVLGRGMAFRDGTGKPCRMAGTLSEFHRNASRLAGTMTDITEKKQAEEALRRVEEQLRQAQKMEAVGKLAGGISHDFNNLLTAIMGYCELVYHRLSPSDPSRSEIAEINKAADRAASLTRQLLAFSRQQVLQPKVLNLNSVVVEMEKMLRRLITENIEFTTELAPDLGYVRVDPNQIEQILMNLIVNARDAMPQGGKLTISTANVDLDEAYARRHLTVVPGPYLALSVSDTGVGISEEVKSRLFEPFFTTKERGKGTGLGLSTVYGIVRQSGGDIAVSSKLGAGTTFRILLPRVQDVPETAPVPAPISQLPGGNETVLVVEDEESLRQMMGLVLREQGYSVLEASNGEEALRVVEKQNANGIDILLTDVLMPRMGGKELADHLRKRWPRAKVLYASGYTENAIDPNGVLEAGVAFLAKPFTLTRLTGKVREVLDRRLPN